MQLQSSGGSVLASATTTTSNESITYEGLSPGTYYIRVYGSGTGSCNSYSLSASATV